MLGLEPLFVSTAKLISLRTDSQNGWQYEITLNSGGHFEPLPLTFKIQSSVHNHSFWDFRILRCHGGTNSDALAGRQKRRQTCQTWSNSFWSALSFLASAVAFCNPSVSQRPEVPQLSGIQKKVPSLSELIPSSPWSVQPWQCQWPSHGKHQLETMTEQILSKGKTPSTLLLSYMAEHQLLSCGCTSLTCFLFPFVLLLLSQHHHHFQMFPPLDLPYQAVVEHGLDPISG